MQDVKVDIYIGRELKSLDRRNPKSKENAIQLQLDFFESQVKTWTSFIPYEFYNFVSEDMSEEEFTYLITLVRKSDKTVVLVSITWVPNTGGKTQFQIQDQYFDDIIRSTFSFRSMMDALGKER